MSLGAWCASSVIVQLRWMTTEHAHHRVACATSFKDALVLSRASRALEASCVEKLAKEILIGFPCSVRGGVQSAASQRAPGTSGEILAPGGGGPLLRNARRRQFRLMILTLGAVGAGARDSKGTGTGPGRNH